MAEQSSQLKWSYWLYCAPCCFLNTNNNRREDRREGSLEEELERINGEREELNEVKGYSSTDQHIVAEDGVAKIEEKDREKGTEDEDIKAYVEEQKKIRVLASRSTDSASEYSNKSSKSIKKKQRKKHAASPDSNYTMIRVGLHNSGLPQRPKPGEVTEVSTSSDSDTSLGSCESSSDSQGNALGTRVYPVDIFKGGHLREPTLSISIERPFFEEHELTEMSEMSEFEEKGEMSDYTSTDTDTSWEDTDSFKFNNDVIRLSDDDVIISGDDISNVDEVISDDDSVSERELSLILSDIESEDEFMIIRDAIVEDVKTSEASVTPVQLVEHDIEGDGIDHGAALSDSAERGSPVVMPYDDVVSGEMPDPEPVGSQSDVILDVGDVAGSKSDLDNSDMDDTESELDDTEVDEIVSSGEADTESNCESGIGSEDDSSTAPEVLEEVISIHSSEMVVPQKKTFLQRMFTKLSNKKSTAERKEATITSDQSDESEITEYESPLTSLEPKAPVLLTLGPSPVTETTQKLTPEEINEFLMESPVPNTNAPDQKPAASRTEDCEEDDLDVESNKRTVTPGTTRFRRITPPEIRHMDLELGHESEAPVNVNQDVPDELIDEPNDAHDVHDSEEYEYDEEDLQGFLYNTYTPTSYSNGIPQLPVIEEGEFEEILSERSLLDELISELSDEVFESVQPVKKEGVVKRVMKRFNKKRQP